MCVCARAIARARARSAHEIADEIEGFGLFEAVGFGGGRELGSAANRDRAWARSAARTRSVDALGSPRAGPSARSRMSAARRGRRRVGAAEAPGAAGGGAATLRSPSCDNRSIGDDAVVDGVVVVAVVVVDVVDTSSRPPQRGDGVDRLLFQLRLRRDVARDSLE